MRQYLGGGWWIYHYSEQTIVLVSEDPRYPELFDGHKGYVKVQGEAGMTQQQLMEIALKSALATDEEMQKRYQECRQPDTSAYILKQEIMQKAFQTPDDITKIGRKRV